MDEHSRHRRFIGGGRGSGGGSDGSRGAGGAGGAGRGGGNDRDGDDDGDGGTQPPTPPGDVNPPSGEPPLPEWALFFKTPDRLARFYSEIASHFQSAGLTCTLLDGIAVVTHGDGKEERCGLLNLAQLCATHDDSRWPRVIAEHFEALVRTHEHAGVVHAALQRFDAVRKRLVVRLWDQIDLETTSVDAIRRQDIPGLVSVLALDLPDAIRSLRPAEVAAWGKTEDELFEIALENLALATTPQIHSHDLGQNGRVFLITAESYYLAALALRMEQFPEVMGEAGCFLSMPVRHALLAVPFVSVRDVISLNSLMAMTAGLHRDGPGSISRRVYWYRPIDQVGHGGDGGGVGRQAGKGAWIEIPYQIGAEGLDVNPPIELVEQLKAMTDKL